MEKEIFGELDIAWYLFIPTFIYLSKIAKGWLRPWSNSFQVTHFLEKAIVYFLYKWLPIDIIWTNVFAISQCLWITHQNI